MKLPLISDSRLFYTLAFCAVGILYILGSFLDIMDVDAAQYASISRDMQVSGSYLQVYERGEDYLDKPPLLFWFTSLAFSLFGASNLAYRIFPILFTILGAYATFGLGKLYYGARVGKLASLLLVSCQAFFLIHHDVRTDTMLVDSLIFAIWQLALFEERKKMQHLLLGFLGVGLAMLAKGPIGLMVPVLAFSTDFALKRKWSAFFRWQWLVGLLVVCVMIAPMCYGLYQQFDMHPEKVINGGTKKSGLYFYFWSQSFGRLTGQNDFINTSSEPEIQDPFFFVHSFLWSFLPWALLFLPALFLAIREVWKSRFRLLPTQEALTLGGIILPFIALSFSKYKLPHYIYVMFPLVAILTARYAIQIIENPKSALFRWSNGFQVFTCAVLWALALYLGGYAFPVAQWLIIAGLLLALATVVHFLFQPQDSFERLIFPSFFTILGINLLLNAHIYPTLFTYQSGSQMARYARYEAGVDSKRLFAYQAGGDSFYHQSADFYSASHLAGSFNEPKILLEKARAGKIWAYTNKEGLASLEAFVKANPTLRLKVLRSFPRFHISTLNIEFINPATRYTQTQETYLVELKGER
ncbi:MAG: glycosyltransferase family 39 protein [Bacteroidetes bacterium]|nr:MAG: glycosyltransferase family 39 protein [Bacteroidota bacterium]